MDKKVFFVFMACITFCSMSCTSKKMKNVGTEYQDGFVEIAKENKGIAYTAMYCGIDKTPFIAFFNRDSIDMSSDKQHVWCFDSLGREMFFRECIGTYWEDFSNLLQGDPPRPRALLICEDVYNQNGKRTQRSFRTRQNLPDFMSSHDIRLLDNTRLTLSKLPKSRYYLFIDWYWVYPEQAYETIRRIDSACVINKDIAFVKVHNTNYKGTPFR